LGGRNPRSKCVIETTKRRGGMIINLQRPLGNDQGHGHPRKFREVAFGRRLIKNAMAFNASLHEQKKAEIGSMKNRLKFKACRWGKGNGGAEKV